MNKHLFLLGSLFIGMILIFSQCKKDQGGHEDNDQIQGAPGNPRFNLQFNNADNVDLDLHVLTPNGTEISFANPYGQGGTLDVDCLCGSCPDGPNENIFWQEGTAPHGTYQFWVEYYGDCNFGNSSSNYTLRLMKNSQIVQTYTGALSPGNTRSAVYTVNY